MLTGEIATFYKKFDEETAWNHLETNLNISGSIFLPTRTTFRMSLFGLLRDFSTYTTRIPFYNRGTFYALAIGRHHTSGAIVWRQGWRLQ
jgi:hypothetical protein